MLRCNEPAPVAAQTAFAAPQFQFNRPPARSMFCSYGLLLLFVLLLYSNLSILFPALEVVRPAQLTAGAVVTMLVVEVVFSHRGLNVAWPEGLFLIGFLAAAGLSCLNALWPRLAFEGLVDLTKMTLIFFAIVNCVTSERRVRCVIWVMLIGGLAPAIGALRNYAAGNLLEGRAAWVGLFANPNELAYSLVILLPLAACLAANLGWLPRLAMGCLAIVYLAAIFVTFSRGAFVGLGAAFIVFGWRRRSVLMLAVLALSAIGGLALAGRYWSRGEGFSNLGKDVSFQQRLATSRAGLAMFTDHPLVGVGLACSLIAWPLYAPPDLYTRGRGELVTHNTFIQPLSETGIVGFTLFIIFLGAGVYHARKLASGPRDSGLTNLGIGLEASLYGFAGCGLSGGYVVDWFPYMLVALVCSVKRAVEESQ